MSIDIKTTSDPRQSLLKKLHPQCVNLLVNLLILISIYNTMLNSIGCLFIVFIIILHNIIVKGIKIH